jgi:hypothetical protein
VTAVIFYGGIPVLLMALAPKSRSAPARSESIEIFKRAEGPLIPNESKVAISEIMLVMMDERVVLRLTQSPSGKLCNILRSRRVVT